VIHIINLRTKFEVLIFTPILNIAKVVKNFRKYGDICTAHSRSLEMALFNRLRAEFLTAFYILQYPYP